MFRPFSSKKNVRYINESLAPFYKADEFKFIREVLEEIKTKRDALRKELGGKADNTSDRYVKWHELNKLVNNFDRKINAYNLNPASVNSQVKLDLAFELHEDVYNIWKASKRNLNAPKGEKKQDDKISDKEAIVLAAFILIALPSIFAKHASNSCKPSVEKYKTKTAILVSKLKFELDKTILSLLNSLLQAQGAYPLVISKNEYYQSELDKRQPESQFIDYIDDYILEMKNKYSRPESAALSENILPQRLAI